MPRGLQLSQGSEVWGGCVNSCRIPLNVYLIPSVCPWSKSCHLQSTEVSLHISNILWYVPEPENRRVPQEETATGQRVVWLKVMLLCIPEQLYLSEVSSWFSLL